jgi:predicted ATPase
MLTHIRIENFKVWPVLDMPLGSITLLFGTNSSGKSSVLQSLLLLKQTAQDYDRSLRINLGGPYVDLGSYRDLIFGHDVGKDLRIRLEWTPIRPEAKEIPEIRKTVRGKKIKAPTTQLRYDVTWHHFDEFGPDVERLSYEALRDEDFQASLEPRRPHFFLDLNRESTSRYRITAPEKVKDLLKGHPSSIQTETVIESCFLFPPLPYQSQGVDYDPSIFPADFAALMQNIRYLGPLREYPLRNYLARGMMPEEIGFRGERAIELLVAATTRNPQLLRNVREWLTKLQLAENFTLKAIDERRTQYEARVQIAGDHDASLLDVGFGISQVLPVIALLLNAPEGAIVLLEQPELHLHPSAQAGLADLFLEVAETRGLQLIVESHSEYLLTRLQRRIAEAEHPKATPEHVKLYFCRPSSDGSQLEAVHADKYGQIHNWPDGFFGDVRGDLSALTDAALHRRMKELEGQE